MSYANQIAKNYSHGDLLGAIKSGLGQMGKSPSTVNVDDLGPVDEFHIGGRVASQHLFNQVDVFDNHHILDIGCGLGGAARFVASKYRCQVTGIDLTQEYIDVGNELCSWVSLSDKVALHFGSALELPFQDQSFNGAYMIHVGMNIEAKKQLFSEIYRVLKDSAFFAIYDIMQTGVGVMNFPVPWATQENENYLSSPEDYRKILTETGFHIEMESSRREFGLEFFEKIGNKTKANGGPPPLGLHTLMRSETPLRIRNMIDNIQAGCVAPIEMIAKK